MIILSVITGIVCTMIIVAVTAAEALQERAVQETWSSRKHLVSHKEQENGSDIDYVLEDALIKVEALDEVGDSEATLEARATLHLTAQKLMQAFADAEPFESDCIDPDQDGDEEVELEVEGAVEVEQENEDPGRSCKEEERSRELRSAEDMTKLVDQFERRFVEAEQNDRGSWNRRKNRRVRP